MRCVLILACLSTVALADPKPYGRDVLLDAEQPRYWNDERHYALVPWVDPLRGVITHGGNQHDIAMQNKIVQDVYSPTYYQPTLVVDYRYLKNGRMYTRGLGGQVLILPVGVKDHGHNSYDRLLEHLKEEEHERDDEHKHRLPYGHREEEKRPMWVPERILERVRELVPERELERDNERSWQKLPAWRGPTAIPEREVYGK